MNNPFDLQPDKHYRIYTIDVQGIENTLYLRTSKKICVVVDETGKSQIINNLDKYIQEIKQDIVVLREVYMPKLTLDENELDELDDWFFDQ